MARVPYNLSKRFALRIHSINEIFLYLAHRYVNCHLCNKGAEREFTVACSGFFPIFLIWLY